MNGIHNFVHAYITAQAPTQVKFGNIKGQLEGTHSQLKCLADLMKILVRSITKKDGIAATAEAKTTHLATKDEMVVSLKAKLLSYKLT